MLTHMGAHDSVLAWEERRMRREVRATANRLANFDDANLRRSARAAVAAGARVSAAMDILSKGRRGRGSRDRGRLPTERRITCWPPASSGSSTRRPRSKSSGRWPIRR